MTCERSGCAADRSKVAERLGVDHLAVAAGLRGIGLAEETDKSSSNSTDSTRAPITAATGGGFWNDSS